MSAQIAQRFAAIDRRSNGSHRVSLVYNAASNPNPNLNPIPLLLQSLLTSPASPIPLPRSTAPAPTLPQIHLKLASPKPLAPAPSPLLHGRGAGAGAAHPPARCVPPPLSDRGRADGRAGASLPRAPPLPRTASSSSPPLLSQSPRMLRHLLLRRNALRPPHRTDRRRQGAWSRWNSRRSSTGKQANVDVVPFDSIRFSGNKRMKPHLLFLCSVFPRDAKLRALQAWVPGRGALLRRGLRLPPLPQRRQGPAH
jgi:hypothetical protein